jgi:hypothetical protein
MVISVLTTIGCADVEPENAVDSEQSPPPRQDGEIRLDKWFNFSGNSSGFLYPQNMLFDSAGAHTACVWFNAETSARPTPMFLEAYRNHASLRYGVDLPLGKTQGRNSAGRAKDVCPNGYWNDPPFPEFDYRALVRDLFERYLNSGMSPVDLEGVYLSIDIEHGYVGYRKSKTAASGSVPGVYRSGAIYFDPANPDSPLNCTRAAYQEGQRLQLQMCKLAELVRRESIRRFGSAPTIGWYDQIAVPHRIRINDAGEIDGSGKTPPNQLWRDLTPEQKKVVLDRMMVNCRPLMTGGVLPDDGVRYPGIDVLELNAQQDELITSPEQFKLSNRNQRTIDVGQRLLEERRSGAPIPPVIVFSSWAFNDKLNAPEQGILLPESQVRDILVGGYEKLEVSGYLMYDFLWEMFISNCFNLQKPSWQQMDQRNREMADDAWRSIWTVIAEREGTEALPGYRPTAQATIGNGGFSDNLSIRTTWLTSYVRFLKTHFGQELSKATQGPRVVP